MVAFAISLGGILYQHIAELPNWKKDMPGALVSHRAYFRHAGFGNFFKVFMPLSSVCLLIALCLLWNRPVQANIWTPGAMAGLVLTAAFTSFYFVPRHARLFSEEISAADTAGLAALVRQWEKGNLVRIAVMILTLIAFFKAWQTLFANG